MDVKKRKMVIGMRERRWFYSFLAGERVEMGSHAGKTVQLPGAGCESLPAGHLYWGASSTTFVLARR